ncbi:MAG: hypothetical protein NC089_09755 [Bacteroides sp.]|nr:hypothetical protein [Bacteroides sp.]MCM1549117.1 hypothetical protein [Clostridium sp.]
MKITKRITMLISMLCFIILLTACDSNGSGQGQAAAGGKSPSEVVVLKVGESEVYLNEVNFYALSFMERMNITEETDLSASFSQEFEDMDAALKAQFLISLRQAHILYQKASEEGITLTADETTDVERQVREYMAANDAERLEEFGIDEELLTRVFTMSQTIQKYEQKLVEEMEVESVSYGTYYNFAFLTIELDENGSGIINDDGTYAYLSDSEQEHQKELAEEVRERLLAGDEPEALIEEYELSATSGLLHATKESLQDTFGLKDGEVSEVKENDFGYVVVKIQSVEDAEYSAQVKEYNASIQAQDYLTEQEQIILDAFPINEEDIVEKVWDAFTFKDFQ